MFKFPKNDDESSKTLLIENEPLKPSHPPKLLEIQGLRGVAIFAVLLFHISPALFKQGFLGVDVFFSISGFLICSILTHKCPLDLTKILNFYFRRLKRIVPLYLFTIFIVLFILSAFILYPFDFDLVYKKVWKSLAFCANLPDANDKGYFVKDEYLPKFFLHLWSLSVEIQFYLIIPLLIYTLYQFSTNFKYIIVILIAILSFVYQLIAQGDHEHMDLLARIWQFMFGFLAFYVREFDEKSVNSSQEVKDKLNRILNHSIDTLLTFSLIIFLFIEFFPWKQLSRLFISIICLIIMSRRSEFKILSIWPLMELGNVSYSIYMIHWPLFQMFSYWKMHQNSMGISIEANISLVLFSILIGYLMEKIWERLTTYINSWKSLIIFISVLYFLIFEAIAYLQLNELDKSLLNNPPPLLNPQQIGKDAIRFWENKTDFELDTQSSILYNQQFKQMVVDLSYCPNRNRSSIPTNFDLRRIGFGNVIDNVVGITSSCVLEGNGTKNIVIFGNSHARASHFGTEHNFRGIYKHLTMFSMGACFFIPWKGHIPTASKENHDGCLRFIENMYKILEQWKHPIHIIVVAHAYYFTPEMENTPFLNKTIDESYQRLQKMYSKLGQIAKDVVLFSKVQFNTGVIDQTKMIIKKIMNKEDLGIFRIPYEHEHNRARNIKDRLNAITCPNCVPLNWEEIWCKPNENICDSVDHQRKISYFFDFNHVNVYGSLRNGAYIRKKYDQWLKNESLVLSE